MRGTKNFMLKIVSFTCNACGTDGDDSPFVCTVCQLIVHKTCISFPRSIKLRIHQHPRIIHTYHLQQCNSRNKYCGICRDGVDTNYGVYYCQDCDFVAHVNCGIKYRQSNTESDEDERSITMNDEFIESSFDIIREIKHGDERIIAEIKHFSHQHNLILSDEFSNDLKCDGCMLPICTPFYSCTGCNFSLDKACIRLPRRNFWQYHGHPLILILNTREKYPFQCAVYSIEHSGHEHPLYLAVESENRHCSGCGVSAEYGTFRCVDCDFNLDFKCATLPDKARHRYDKHPLFLTYIDPNDYQYVCQICEKERDPKLWFYRCEKCDFDANPECVLGKYPFIKLGDSYIFDNQPHPLVLVEKIEDYPACHDCGKPCDGLALECHRCNFIIHWKRWECFNPWFK
uniref:DC1 domain-containing protein n=1 Tax=Salix viminalis TaxID=40686 RepID=A0A6N2N5P2_SALVM